MEPELSRQRVSPGALSRLQPLLRWESGLAIASVAIVLLGLDVSSQFLTNGNLFYLCISVGEVAIMTLPLTFIVITGEIDLSVASTLGLASALVGYLWSHGWPMALIIPTVLAVGVLTGAFNGLLVTRLGLPSLAVTIGTLTLYRGIAVILLGPNTISNFPFSYTTIGVDPVPHTFLSYSVLIFLILALVFGVILHFTPFGRSLYAIGANQEAAIFAGIRVKRTKLLLFIVSGVVCSAAGILYTFRLSTAVQDNGVGLELSVVAIVLLGGVSIFGGTGSIIGVVLAVFVFAGLQNALFLTNFNELALGIVTGGLLLVSVLVPNASSFVRRARESLRRRQVRGQAAAAGRKT
ncbi:MAG TPA: ABC transporter permease [Gaiellaceae bacterium]|nr:ABC transporter permease [Gaiellaceae bacterium]